MWSTVGIFLKPLLAEMASLDIVAYRFLVAALGFWLILLFTRQLPTRQQWRQLSYKTALLGALGLVLNFALFNHALHYISASDGQVLTPLGPFFAILIGLYVFKERLSPAQLLGLLLLCVGLLLFFNQRLFSFQVDKDSLLGLAMGVLAAACWAAYALAQKQLSAQFSALQILALLYGIAALCYLPVNQYQDLRQLSPLAWGSLAYVAVNTIIAYGAYAQALHYWGITKVNLLLPLMPIITIVFSYGLHALHPRFEHPALNLLAYAGAVLVVLGSLWSAVGDRCLAHWRRMDRGLAHHRRQGGAS